MDFHKELAGFKQKIDKQIARQFEVTIKETKKQDAFSVELISYAKKVTLAGGKRLRPMLLFWGYVAAGGKDRKKIMQVAVAMELIHMFLLIHDDIMDKGLARHGVDSLNFHFEKVAKKIFKHGNAKEFGDACAIIAGNMLFAMGNQLVANSGLNEKNNLKVVGQLQRVIFATAVGQMQDVYMEHSRDISEKQVLAMYRNKTAQYTFEGPLTLGALLAGQSNPEFLRGISDYAIPLGIAFQIQDDILGIFGSAKKLGKSTVSDIEEGKETILVVKAREGASKIQKKEMAKLLGKQNVSQAEVKDFQKIIIETKSLKYAKEMITVNISKSKRVIDKLEISKNAREFLFGMADFMEKREM